MLPCLHFTSHFESSGKKDPSRAPKFSILHVKWIQFHSFCNILVNICFVSLMRYQPLFLALCSVFMTSVFLSNLHIRDLKTYPWTYFGHFWNISHYDDFKTVWVLFRKKVLSENQRILIKEWQSPLFQFSFRRAGIYAISWVNLIGPVIHLGGCWGLSSNDYHILDIFIKD